jgi:hypothetical protein
MIGSNGSTVLAASDPSSADVNPRRSHGHPGQHGHVVAVILTGSAALTRRHADSVAASSDGPPATRF